eukprot:4256497-Ditylum_brightwellii.AAC.1
MDIFLKTDWQDKQNWSREKLWSGRLAVFQLRKTVLTAIRDACNLHNTRILAMVDTFLTLPKDSKTLADS